jgi:hypothetical protein
VLTDGEKVIEWHGMWLRGLRDWLGRRGGSADSSLLCTANAQRCVLIKGCQPMAGNGLWRKGGRLLLWPMGLDQRGAEVNKLEGNCLMDKPVRGWDCSLRDGQRQGGAGARQR